MTLSYDDITEKLIDGGFPPTVIIKKGKVECVEVYSSALQGEVRLKKIREMLGCDGLRINLYTNLEIIEIIRNEK